jgi:2-(1,2-epoxy-1,2-dihydrophenyl)acetyl-CoA isomerase
MTKPLLRAAADSTWEGSLTMEEFAEPIAFTTGDFARSVQAMLGRD